MARGRKAKRGGTAKPQADGTLEALPESVETQIEDAVADVTTPEVAAEAVDVGKAEAVEEVANESPNETTEIEGEITDGKDTPKKGDRKRFRGKKGKKPPSDDSLVSKDKNVVDFAGLIFMCNSKTKKDCFKYRVFGLPEAKKDLVEKVKKGTKLFLFDIDKRVLHGVYKASSEGGMNLIEEAFQDSNRKFPAQVRFRIQKDCMPLDESAFKLAIKENYFKGKKFKCELNAEQVGRLIKLFRPLDSRGLPEPKPSREAKREFNPKGKLRQPPFQSERNQGPPPRFSAPAPRKRVYKDRAPPVYSRESAYPREPVYHIPEIAPHYALMPSVTQTEVELMRQRHLRQAPEEALDRRAYLVDPLEASYARKRFIEDAYAAEQLALASKRPLLLDPVYRELEYQREAPYRSYDPLSAGAFPYDPRSY